MTAEVSAARKERARTISEVGFNRALAGPSAFVSLSEVVVLGLIRQGVRVFISVFGHGSTELGEVLRIYEQAGQIRTFNVRNEIEASHAAAALRWVTGEKAAVVTSIGPGALQAMAASVVAASDGIGVWYLFGDETTEDEGPNMQQIPKAEQNLFLRLAQTMGQGYCLHTPEAVGTALLRGRNVVDHPYRPGPFYLLMPMNVQGRSIPSFNFDELPEAMSLKGISVVHDEDLAHAVDALRQASRPVVKVGGGARGAGKEIREFLELIDGVAVTSPLVSGVIPYDHPRNMTVGGSKGSLCGNYAMEEADLLVTLGTRFVCQSDCSRTGYPKVKRVININTDLDAATHYNRSISFIGDVSVVLRSLIEKLKSEKIEKSKGASPWFQACLKKKREWEAFKSQRYATPTLYDDVWGREVLTQPAVIKAATDWARQNGAVSFFDAGDVQANGFQIVEDDRLGRTFTETGASYMGFAVSALLATGLAAKPFYGLAFTGDGSFTMNPQILIDGVQHRARGCILLLDNRRMAAISGLQRAQYGMDYATQDGVEVDYVAWAKSIKGVAGFFGGYTAEHLLESLTRAISYDGLSLIHVPVYFGDNPLGGMGVFGRWNVGNWCKDVQSLRHRIGL